MATNSTINNHKDFDSKVKNLVGKEMHQQFLILGIKICHIKKICLKIGSQQEENFKRIFLKACELLLIGVRSLTYVSSTIIKKQISEIFSSNDLKIK